MNHQQFLENEEATIAFGCALARATHAGESDSAINEGKGTATIGAVIHLNGELGAGKTTLTRGILRGYGYGGAVKSPTYTLVEPYEFEKCQIYHFDLYRLADPEEVEYLGTEDYFLPGNLCIVEWADRGKHSIPQADLTITLNTQGTGRQLSCQSHSEKGQKIAQRLWP
ncbi:MAG: tRNA (adenosine(37)-N6)-threonylcarbamoyltransferase complex ATPase subunit type 1 TsaE [Gammaproteobacteria bacterium]|nr:tRNA (adenosine(37)-N6)-threonylcarbamoyltransferase complex ATPase subunit type 1 TsaE [Gammaproteobacteria bacterium]MDD9896401.1 tRNA (adenosine(37)-N6)-threonylcarbamoyltransferase complex ATPase subunit type 1 TsaE [Gammaproteobacteria bacterium]MDD9957691.1 tRNA (adenosine(37)-N6)-threonylcarbamoyltransferase complex ATPase subunit type 1 TsaE [Gammaproteobacteria bacterium]